MKQRYIYISILAVLLATLFTGCKKEEGTVTLGAVIKNTVYMNEKVYISDHTPCWHNGDQVNINGTTYSIVAASGASAQIPEVTRHDTYRAIFPASIVNSNNTNISNNSSISVTLPSEQYFQMVGNHQRVDVPMGAYMTSGSTLHFYNLCSVVRVTVSNSLNTDLSLSSIMLHAVQARLSGAGTVTVTGAESNSIRMNNSSSNPHTVTLVFTEDAPAIVDALGSSTFDIVVPEFTTDDIDITVFTTDGHFFTLSKSNVGLTHNTITTVTANVTELNQNTTTAELISGPAFNGLIPSTATSIEFICETPWVASGTLLSTSNSAAPIYGNLEGGVWRITTSARSINANTNCSQMFMNKRNLTSIIFNDGFNTSNVTNMSSMFEGCESLDRLNLSCFNTSLVTNMSKMFKNCRCGNEGINLTNFNTSSVTDMSEMFSGCNTRYFSDYYFEPLCLDLSSFNTSNVINMSGMFKGCYTLRNLNLSNFNTQNVTDMSYMFYYTTILDGDEQIVVMAGISTLDLSSFNTSNVTNMSYMFGKCAALTSLNLSNFNTSNVTNMNGMFNSCHRLTSLDISHFDMSNVTSKTDMCKHLSIYTGNFTVPNHCTITCPLSVQTAMQSGTNLPSADQVTFTWVRPTSK
ncbi:MAG: BspA family leucine-rich repeat surface protein [Bacteroidales bacterium]|nr:BspA family leucine-rich repeat surface protein [Bacteroidales bacterium]